MRKNGFTMIELLVVIAILGLLMTMGLSSYGKSLSRGRDSKRLTDMQEVQKGFELYYAKHNTYAAIDTMFGDTDLFPQSKPNPPVGSREYGGWANASSYMYCAELENTGNTDNDKRYGNAICNDDLNTVGNCNFASLNFNAFCVANAQ